MRVAVVLFTRDLRVHDNPALAAAAEAAETVLPLFVLDEGIRRTRYGAAANRRAFLAESLADLDASLRRLGGALVVRRGEVVAETVRAARDVGATKRLRERRRQPVRRRAGGTASWRRRSTSASSTATSSSLPERSSRPGTTTTRSSRPTTVPGRRCRSAHRSRRLPDPPADRRRPGRRSRPGACGSRERRRDRRRRARGGLAARAPRRLRLGRPRRACGRHDLAAVSLSPLRLRLAALARRSCAERRGDAFVRQLCWRELPCADPLRPAADADGRHAAARRPLARRSRRCSRPGRRGDGLPARRRRHACNCARRAGCTTGPGWSLPRSSSRTSESTGERERATSSSCCSTGTWHRT